MSSKSSRKQERRKNRNGRFRNVVKNNWGKTLTFFLGVLAAGAGWYLSNCLSDRKGLAKELRQAALASRLADEKFSQDIVTLDQQVTSLVRYLEQAEIDLTEIVERRNKIASQAQLTNIDCNISKEALYKYRASRNSIAKYYFLPEPVWRESPFEECGGLTELSQGLYLPDPKRLVSDRDYRSDFVYRQKLYFDRNKAVFARMKEVAPIKVRFDEELITSVESRNSSVIKISWDCLKLLFGNARH